MAKRKEPLTQHKTPTPAADRPLLLTEEFALDPPQPMPGGRHQRLTQKERRYVLYCLADEVSVWEIARRLGRHRNTAWRFLREARLDAEEFALCGVVVDFARAEGSHSWICRLCGSSHRERGEAVQHGYQHVWPLELQYLPPWEKIIRTPRGLRKE